MKTPTRATSVKKSTRVIYTVEQFKKDQDSSRKVQPIFESWGL